MKALPCASSLEPLESRIAPAGIKTSFADHTLTVTGDGTDNDLTITSDTTDHTILHLSSMGSINGSGNDFTTPKGVKNLVVLLGGGSDTLSLGGFSDTLVLDGDLTVDSGAGPNTTNLLYTTVGKNASFHNGSADSSGANTVSFANSPVGGNIDITNGAGDTATTMTDSIAKDVVVGGNFTLHNGAGYDTTILQDINFRKNVTVSNGHANDQSNPGFTNIINDFKPIGVRSYIGGNMKISFLDGSLGAGVGIEDQVIHGNVKVDFGTSPGQILADSFSSNLPVLIRGSLTVTGKESVGANLGTHSDNLGLHVGKALKVKGGGGGVSTNLLEVGGATAFTFGAGGSTISLNDAIFAGPLRITTGPGADTLNLDTAASSAEPTVFEKPVIVKSGGGNDVVNHVGHDDGEQRLIVVSTFVIHHGTGADNNNTADASTREFFPFSNTITYVV